jgi:tagatose kinase
MGCSLMINKELAEKIINYAVIVKKSGSMISFDPNFRIELLNKKYIKSAVKKITDLADIILPGLQELLLIAEEENKEKSLKKLLVKNRIIVLKLGKRGCEIYYKGDKMFIPSFKIKEVDPTGAGDSFDAGFLCSLIENREIYECGIMANACGALNSTKFGPMEGVFGRKKVDSFIKKNKS